MLPEDTDLSVLSPAWLLSGGVNPEAAAAAAAEGKRPPAPAAKLQLSMVLLVAILDPPREEAVRAVGVAHKAGITVKMITGGSREGRRAVRAWGWKGEERTRAVAPMLEHTARRRASRTLVVIRATARVTRTLL